MTTSSVPWGCACGRLCAPEDDECDACDAPRSSGSALRTEKEKTKFLRRAEKRDRRVLEEAGTKLAAVETSYRDTAGEFDKHCRAMNAGLEPWLDDAGYGAEDYAELYADTYEPWMWG